MATTPETPLTHRNVLKIAVPIMLSNVTEPLIGVVNTSVVGQLPNPALIGGVAVGAMVFSFLFWGFGFLRLSTSGLSAQATGAGHHGQLGFVIARSFLLGLVIGAILLALSPLIGPLGLGLIGGSPEVQAAAATYFGWRIFAAPAALANFAILGWFIGQGRSLEAFFIQVLLNLCNMVLSAVFVLGQRDGIAGVGMAAMIAEYAGLVFGVFMVVRRLHLIGQPIPLHGLFELATLRPLLAANADIMVRTLCLLFAFAWFTAHGARSGTIIVAANAMLMNFFEVSAYLIDGFAYAAEALAGQAIGARNRVRFIAAVRLSTVWAISFGILAAGLMLIAGPRFIDLMSVDPDVQATARTYLGWAALTPILGAACFLFDGIFTGALATRDMRNMMVAALAIYLPSSIVLEQNFANHGLWAAMCIFFASRSLLFGWKLKSIIRHAFEGHPQKSAVLT